MADDQNKSKNNRAPNSLGAGTFQSGLESLGRKFLSQDADYINTKMKADELDRAASDIPEMLQSPQWHGAMSGHQMKLRGREMASQAKGMSTMMRSMNSIGDHAESFLGRDQLRNEMKSGSLSMAGATDPVKMGNINAALTDQATKLTEALKKLHDGTEKTAEQMSALRETAHESAQNYDKLSTANSMRQQSMANYSQMANAIGGGFMALSGGAQQIMVSQRLGQQANIAGYAGLENEKYSMYQKAQGGDVMSQLMLSQWDNAEGFGRSLKTGINVSQGLRLGGGAAQTAAGGLQVASALSPGQAVVGTSDAANAAISGGMNVVGGVTDMAVTGANMVRGVDSGAADIAGRQARMQAMQQVLAVSASQMQGFRDFGVGLGNAAVSMGSSGEAFLNRTITGDNMEKMVNARISPEQFAKMSSFGAENMGSTFNESQIFGVRGMERSGFGSMQANMGRMANLAAAGSNNPQAGLASILEVALTKGLDNSKVLGMVADNTASLVGGSMARAMGLDTTAAQAFMSTASLDTSDPNKEFATTRALTAAEKFREIGTNTETSFSGMVNIARAAKALRIDTSSAERLGAMDPADLMQLRFDMEHDKSPNKAASRKAAKEHLKGRGIGIGDNDVESFVKEAVDLKVMQLAEVKGGSMAMMGVGGFSPEKLMQYIKQGKKFNELPDDFATTLGAVAGRKDITGQQLYSQMTGMLQGMSTTNQKATVDKIMAGEAGGEKFKTLNDMHTQGFKQMTQAALEATKFFKSAGDALKGLSELAKQSEKYGDAGGEGKFKTAAADAAGSFGSGAKLFSGSVGVFDAAVNRLAAKSGINSDAAANIAKKSIEELKAAQEKVKSKKGQ